MLESVGGLLNGKPCPFKATGSSDRLPHRTYDPNHTMPIVSNLDLNLGTKEKQRRFRLDTRIFWEHEAHVDDSLCPYKPGNTASGKKMNILTTKKAFDAAIELQFQFEHIKLGIPDLQDSIGDMLAYGADLSATDDLTGDGVSVWDPILMKPRAGQVSGEVIKMLSMNLSKISPARGPLDGCQVVRYMTCGSFIKIKSRPKSENTFSGETSLHKEHVWSELPVLSFSFVSL